jgi:hypothetical protein
MKSDGYDFGPKNNWRRWAWNRICERLSCQRKDAIVVYLAGEEDLDRYIAVSKGFNPNNLIAVDINYNVIKKIKEKGGLAIHGNILNVIQSFYDLNTKIDVLICDFCHGLNKEIDNLAYHLSSPKFARCFNDKSVILINMLRGRETKDSEIKNLLSNFALEKLGNKIFISPKHRGEMFINSFSLIISFLKSNIDYYELNIESRSNIEMSWDENGHFRSNIPVENIIKSGKCIGMGDVLDTLNSVFFTYQNNRHNMDSVIFNYNNKDFINLDDINCELVFNEDFINNTNKTRAIMAVRTMKQNGKLSPSPVC